MVKFIKRIYQKIFYRDEYDLSVFFKKFFYIKSNYEKKSIIHKFKKKKYELDVRNIEIKYNCGIPTETDIKETITFPHGLNGIFISKGAKIGENCIIFHQVTIGSNTLKDSKHNGSPIIGDNVYIGTGAKIIGNVKVGNNCRIGANCVVVKDVPDNMTVVLGENRLIQHKQVMDNKFYRYQENKKEPETLAPVHTHTHTQLLVNEFLCKYSSQIDKIINWELLRTIWLIILIQYYVIYRKRYFTSNININNN